MRKLISKSIAVGAVVLGVVAASVWAPQPVAAAAQGRALRYDRYVTVTRKSYSVWSSFNFKHRKTTTTKLYHQTLRVQVRYHHHNHSDYLSLRNRSGRWLGYVNAKAVKVASGAQGVAIATSRTVALTHPAYAVWNGFSFRSVRHYAKNYPAHVYRVRAVYHHFNGSTYLSLYDHAGRWFGYINQSGAPSSTAQGPGVAVNRYAQVVAARYTQWQSFAFKTGYTMSGTSNHPLFQVKRVYYHVNGGTYLSLYTPAGWAGYINAASTKAVSAATYAAQAKYFATVATDQTNL